MTKIIGARIDEYHTAIAIDYGGHYDVSQHRVVTELHATKGWRTVARRKNRVLTTRLRSDVIDLLGSMSSRFLPRGGVGARATNQFGIQPLQVRP